MGRLEIGKKILQIGQKYRYALIVLAVGVVLMLLPSFSEKHKVEQPQPTQAEKAVTDLAQQLENLLCQMGGAGRVSVMLTVAEGEKTVYQTDTDTSDTGARWETVIVTGTDRNQNGVIQQINPVKYLGAIILCQGADHADVRLQITQAVSRATGLGTDKISVLKMK